jgi:hypothetical protein
MSRICVLLSVLFAPSLVQAATVQKFDLPGYSSTCGTAIASNGTIAGVAFGGAGGISQPFLLSGGSFSTPSYGLPTGVVEYNGLNMWGDVVGTDLTTSFATESFKVHGGVVTVEPLTSVNAITDRRAILGQSEGENFTFVGVIMRQNGKNTVLDDGTGHVSPAGMDATAERVVGTSQGANGTVAWSYHAHKFTPITVAGALLTEPTGVDEKGRVSGYYYVESDSGVLSEHGFLLQKGVITSWDVPGAIDTEILGANEAGQVTGCFTDSAGQHGFVATPFSGQ